MDTTTALSAAQPPLETSVTRLATATRPASCSGYSQSVRRSPFVELRNTAPSNRGIIAPLVAQLLRFISRYRGGDQFEIELALSEALANAIVHGNHEDPDKYVYVSCRCSRDGEVSLTVQDEGEGFDVDSIPDPTTVEKRLVGAGRGIYLMRALMDEVCFEQKGTVVHLRKAVQMT